MLKSDCFSLHSANYMAVYSIYFWALTVYNLQQVYQPNEETAQRFIQESFTYLGMYQFVCKQKSMYIRIKYA